MSGKSYNPAMSPCAVRGTCTSLKQWTEGAKGGGRGAATSSYTTKKKRQKMPPVHSPGYDPQAHGILTLAYVSTRLTTRGMHPRFVVDAIKLHFTSLYICFFFLACCRFQASWFHHCVCKPQQDYYLHQEEKVK